MRITCSVYKFITSGRRRCISGAIASDAPAFQCRSSTRGLQTSSQENESRDLDREADDSIAYEHKRATSVFADVAHNHEPDRSLSSQSQPQAHQDAQGPKIRKQLHDDTLILDDSRVKLYVGSLASRYSDINRLLVQRRELHVILNNGSMKSFDPLFLRDSCESEPVNY